MKKIEDKTTKLILSCGAVINLYAPPETLFALHEYRDFLRFKDDGQDHVYVHRDQICAYEILEDRTDFAPPMPSSAEIKNDELTETVE